MAANAAALLAAIVESSDDAIVSTDLEGRIRSWNPGAERMYGYTAEEVIGRHVTILAPPDRPDEIPGILRRLGRGERVAHFETVRIARSGGPIEVSISASPMRDGDGRLVGQSSISHDITERRAASRRLHESQSLLQGLFDAAPEGIIGVDEDGTILFANPATEQLFGYPAAELVGRPVEVLVPEAARGVHAAQRAGFVSRPRQRLNGAGLGLAGRRKDGSTFAADIALGHFAVASGMVVLAFVRDVTRARAAEEQLRKVSEARRLLLSRLVTSQEDERRRIAVEIHDDPVQKLSALSLRLDVLARHHPELVGSGDYGALGQTLRASIDSLRALMFELRPHALDERGLAAALRELLQAEGEFEVFPEHHLEDQLETEPRGEVGTTLYRLAEEAVRNVRKHANASHVDLVLAEGEGGYLLRVADDGVGFAADGRARSPNGHLGLTGMQERAQIAGGWCRIDTELGQGTTVEFFIPADLAGPTS